VPGAAQGVADHQALGERPVIMRAERADGEQLLAAARQQHRLAVDVALQHGAVGDVVEFDAGGEIGAGRLGGVLAHGNPLLLAIGGAAARPSGNAIGAELVPYPSQRRTKMKSPPSWPARRMLAYSGVCSAFNTTASRRRSNSIWPSMAPAFSASASMKARANTEWPPGPASETGSRPPEVSTVRARFFSTRSR